jgi:hypothetical protein
MSAMTNNEICGWLLMAWAQIVMAWYVMRLALQQKGHCRHVGRWLGIVLFLNSPVLLTSLTGRLWLVCCEQQQELMELEILASGRAIPVKEQRDVLEVVYTTRGQFGEYSIARTVSGQVRGAAECTGLDGLRDGSSVAADGRSVAEIARLRAAGAAY